MKLELPLKIENFIAYCDFNKIDVYLVGGFVRDLLLNKKSFDCDICYISDYFKTLEILKKKYKVVSDDKYQSIKFKIDQYNLELSHARKEKDYLDYRHPDKIEFIDDIKLDSLRRDFTINALYYKNNQIYDFYNGLEDLKNHNLVLINDTLTSFKQDPLRILRMIRFSSLGFNISNKDKQIILDNAYLLKELSIVSFEKEFDKILMLNNLYLLYEYKDIFENYYDKKFPDLITLNKLDLLNEKKTYLNIKNKSNLYKYKDIAIINDKLEINKLIYKYNKELIKELIIYYDKIHDSNLINLYNQIIDNGFYDKKNLKLSCKKISQIIDNKELISYYIDKISYLIMENKLENDAKKIEEYLSEMIK